MSSLTTIQLAHLPPPRNRLYAALFTDLQNGPYLRQQLLEGNTEFEYAFIDASTLVSTMHVLSACFRAVNDANNNRLRSRNVHSEIVFGLGSNPNIGANLKNFGVDVATRNLLAIKIASHSQTESETEFDTVQKHLQTNVQGQSLPFTDESLAALTDWDKVIRIYKLSHLTSDAVGREKSSCSSQATNGISGLPDAQRIQEAEINIMGLIALRGS